MTTATWLNPQQQSNAAAQALNSASDQRGGLHPSIIASFPTFPYALVKDHRRGKCGLECAICLSEFAGDEVLRLLTACSHAFHLGCIDLWFESHTTCPVCRRELDPAETSPEKATEVRIPMPEPDGREERAEAEEERAQTQQRISFKEEEEERRRRRRGVVTWHRRRGNTWWLWIGCRGRIRRGIRWPTTTGLR
ncbi:zinc finger protein [Cinnamomum micranthum f. kanehirae]|uniref:RING-type E3 ubiquitin transferase n=1 Tax=Cinnamomum micranthum f. kanehirae TaxID=337451 RepID=A0A3S3NUH3_9MAGN|nr:zinc finger protein [Cinnamomum micranthum f. kanehirae]